MKISKTKFITRTAILLALTIVFQSMGRFIPLGPYSNFIVGPLVNACLLVASAFTGIWGGLFIAVVSPFGAIMTGAAVPLPFAPVVALGNAIIVILFYVFLKKNQILGLISGALLKFAFLFGAVSLFVKIMGIPAKKAGLLLFSFGWPQLVTALVGGIVAIIVIKAIGKNGY